MGNIIKTEIGASPNYHRIKSVIESRTDEFEYYSYGEILRPFFSLNEIKKGDHEVIAISYILHLLRFKFMTILDEEDPRKFVEINFPEILENMTGTVGFVGLCCCKFGIFNKEETITILNLIKKSKFRVRDEIVNAVIETVVRCRDG